MMEAEEATEHRADRAQSNPPPFAKADSEAPPPQRLEVARSGAAKPARRRLLSLMVVVMVALAGVGAYRVLTGGRESTDDSQVAADLVPVSARVGGMVLRVAVREDQPVHAGDVIAQLDDVEYRARVRQAEAELESARAQAAEAAAQVEIVTASSTGGLSSARAAYSGSSVGVASASAEVAAARARLLGAQSEARQAEAALQRAQELSKREAIAPAALEAAQAASDQARAAVARAEAQITAAEGARHAAQARISEAAGRLTQSEPVAAQVSAATANAQLARARIGSREAELEIAKLQLSYTKITAPTAGVASSLSVREGQLVRPGQQLLRIVPNETYVLANFKETQVARMGVGQRASIKIDAYLPREFAGKVVSVGAGTGSSFALLPADNASGNFVKVVQRVPVRIAWVEPPKDVTLRAGLSVDAVVYVAP